MTKDILIHHHYDELMDLVDAAEHPMEFRTGKPFKPLSSHNPDCGSPWHGTDAPDWQACVKLARHGWAAGVKGLASATADLEALRGEFPKLAYTYDVAGDILDVGRYCGGEPECFMVYSTEPAPARVLRLFVPVHGTAGVNQSSMYNRGAAVLGIIDALEHQGVRVDLTAYTYSISGNNGGLVSFTVKRAQDPVDLDIMAYSLCNASVFRRLVFAVKEHASQSIRRNLGVGYGYGRSTTYPRHLRDKGAVYIEHDNNNRTVKEAWQYITCELQRQVPELAISKGDTD